MAGRQARRPEPLEPIRPLIDKSKHGYADREAVEEFAAGLKDRFLLCRDIGHNWKPWVARFDEEHNSFERAHRCVNCRSERWQSVGLRGSILGTQYKYPEGYQSELGRIVGEGRDALRVESLTRTMKAMQSNHLKAV